MRMLIAVVVALGSVACSAAQPTSESFNVLLKELQALCLNVELVENPAMPRRMDASGPGVPAGLAQLAREVAEKVGSANG